MNRKELIEDLERILVEGQRLAESYKGDPDPVPHEGFNLEPKWTVVRRLLTGQVLAISPRVVRLIIEELKTRD